MSGLVEAKSALNCQPGGVRSMSIPSSRNKNTPASKPPVRANFIIIAVTFAIAMVIQVGSALYLEPQLRSLQPSPNNWQQSPEPQISDSPIQEVEVPEDRTWDNEPLTSESPTFTAEVHNENAKAGAPKTVEGLETQTLNFGLRSRNGCVWSPDG